MLAFLKLLQSLVKELHSDGTPAQVAFGAALGAALGLTPIANVHNVVIFALLLLLNVSFGAGMLAWAVFVPLGFALDPLFHQIGRALLTSRALAPMWTSWFNAPLVPYTNFNNTVVLGSVVGWLVLFAPIFFLAKWLIVRYRATYGERVRQSKLYRAVTASQAYNVYRWFRPE
ncbi:MAG: TIGR03546 family protein [Gemmatimonadaceae bacterium]|nr:TIGR03546 family protein [Gemmatimonadaceae bacterium]NUQ91904.1 TIGR03546 family protein [Gemmatimonadaceae bacterium]NUR21029.1 TIGR03546 family protein [Gemmatimonadaceae bacterium]NUS98886.1 TIGR03546 family protein [Gemmatimonadaceae bacterium]